MIGGNATAGSGRQCFGDVRMKPALPAMLPVVTVFTALTIIDDDDVP